MGHYAATLSDLHLIPLDSDNPNTYVSWARSFFNDPRYILNPYLDITLHLDITNARSRYDAQNEGTFTAFLYYYLIQALKKYPEFFYRYIDGQWLQVSNPALFFPIARNERKNRFYEAFIPNIFQLTWPEFSKAYQIEVENSKQHPRLLGSHLFVYSLFIGNLPNLQVTGLTLHVNDRFSAQPYFYFGKRYRLNEKLFVSLSIKFHHSTVDPHIIDLLLEEFQREFQ
ncbi:hypothetical protein BTA51_09150 [Hahella sp. CCB-MM4]|uniref:CatA-like O-acetyltransferase n=1 Tax=Hahella sp. (strain CCB-MM4) TaxID=1926491 RepID=UPI000B9BA8E1|nr:CatA-like O-acetyltransferase [Hahella sp. CCB-MM4]OZG73937.1 hypothetical protein BTA51_09150 [Hahella sp. CCB-MM4]